MRIQRCPIPRRGAAAPRTTPVIARSPRRRRWGGARKRSRRVRAPYLREAGAEEQRTEPQGRERDSHGDAYCGDGRRAASIVARTRIITDVVRRAVCVVVFDDRTHAERGPDPK